MLIELPDVKEGSLEDDPGLADWLERFESGLGCPPTPSASLSRPMPVFLPGRFEDRPEASLGSGTFTSWRHLAPYLLLMLLGGAMAALVFHDRVSGLAAIWSNHAGQTVEHTMGARSRRD